MSHIELVHASCADLKADVAVNAANRNLRAGGGICGVIFSKAGIKELTEACQKFSLPLKDGEAVITPSFHMNNVKAVIHAVGPDFSVTPEAFSTLCDAYYHSLLVLMENGYHSIAFPLISSGIYGGSLQNPVAESVKQCITAYQKFVSEFPDYCIDVKLCAYTEREMENAGKEWNRIKCVF